MNHDNIINFLKENWRKDHPFTDKNILKYFFKYDNSISIYKNNSIIFVCYQGAGSLGKQVQDGIKETVMTDNEGKKQDIKIEMEITTIVGFTAHSGRNELLNFINRCSPRPKKVIVGHGEASKCLDLASSVYKLSRAETLAPRNLETVRLR